MNLSNISKHAKSARNADSKRRKAVPEENPQPTVSAPVQDIQETFVPGEVHTEIPDEVLMDMSELDIREAAEREEAERKSAEPAVPVEVPPVEPEKPVEPAPTMEEYISDEDLKAFVDKFVDKYFPEKELRVDFEKIPVSLERQEEYYGRKVDALTVSIEQMKQDQGQRLSVKKLESMRKSITTKVEKLRAAFKKDNLICFEDLGCDYLVVDEAHAYKNLAIFSKMNNVAGVNVSSNSQRAFDLEIKIRYIQELNNGGGVCLMNGTGVNIQRNLIAMHHLDAPYRPSDVEHTERNKWQPIIRQIMQIKETLP